MTVRAPVGAEARLRPGPLAGVAPAIPPGVRAGSVGGALLGVVGAYWDVAWHVDRGRETFWSPPHLLLYAGILGIVVALLRIAAAAPGGWRAALGHPGLRLAVLAGFATLLSAPFDELWHRLFGIDVSIWSPPHLLLLFGSMLTVLALGLLQAAEGPRAGTRPAAVWLVALALVIANVFVLEFEFPALDRWHVVVGRAPALYPLSVAALAILVLASAARAGTPRFLASQAAAVAWGLRIAIGSLVLPALGASAPRLPPLYVVPAAVLDLALWLAPDGGSPRRRVLLGGAAAGLAGYLAHDPVTAMLGGRVVGWEALAPWLPLAPAAGALAALAGVHIGRVVRPIGTWER